MNDEFSELLLLEVLYQACGTSEDTIDNQCLSVYEEACTYLTKKGYLQTKNGRIYTIRRKEDGV